MTKFLRFLLVAILFSGSLEASERPLLFAPGDAITPSGPTTFCESGNVVLTIDGQEPAATYQWFKDGAMISGANLKSYTATESGSFHVVVTTAGVTKDFEAVVVKENSRPVADFTFTGADQCSNIPVKFTNTSTGNIVSYVWDFGDPNSGASNNKSTSANPQHTFIGTPGNGEQTFNVKLTVKNAEGCEATKTITVKTKQLPDAKLGGIGATTYDGKPYFIQKASNPFQFTFTNPSSTTGTNISYKINWGDGSLDFIENSFETVSHVYGVGPHTITYTVEGQNGCKTIVNYYVYVGANPSVGWGSPGNTLICTGGELTFPITGTDINPPGTTYIITFNDESLPLVLNHPLSESFIKHKFLKGSCGTTSYNNGSALPNSFAASIIASNPSGSTPATVFGIYVSEKPKASFTVSPQKTICLNKTITVTNTSKGNIAGADDCKPGNFFWKIEALTGTANSWTVTGDLGKDFGQDEPSAWQNGSKDLKINFPSPGTYKIILKTGTYNSLNVNCGPDIVEEIICVNPLPVANFDINQNTGCSPLTVKTTNLSNIPICGTNTYNWTVTYANPNNCTPNTNYNVTSSLENPEFNFVNAGIYTIRLVTKNSDGSCTSTEFTKQVTVKAKPVVTLTTPASICAGNSFTATATVLNCYSSTTATYLWSFPGANITSSTDANPVGISYAASGPKTITLAVTNECGTTTVTKPITVNSAPNINPISNLTFCRGETSPEIQFKTTPENNNVTYKWTNSNTAIGLTAGSTAPVIGNLPAFITKNTTSAVITSTITVTPILGGCEGTPTTFTISVNPSAPTANAGTNQKLCNASSVTLSGNNPAPATGKWTLFSGPTDYTIDDDTKHNAVVSNLQPDQTYIFKWTIAGFAPCPATTDTVTIINRPEPTVANAGADHVICNNTSGSNNTYLLQGNTLKSYETGQWTIITQPTGSNATFHNNIKNSPTARINNLRPGTYRLKWSVSNDVCTTGSEDEVIITVYTMPIAGAITGINNVCYDNSFTLTYNGTIGKIIDWEESVDNANWTSTATSTSTLTINNHTQSKWYRIKIGSEGATCSSVVYSIAKQVIANPFSIGGTTSGASTFCSATNSGSLTLSGQTGNVLRWEYSSDNINFNTTVPNTSTTLNYSNIPATRFYRAVVKSGDCDETYSSPVKITINPVAAIANAGPDQYLCEQTSTFLTGNNPGTATGIWTVVSGSGTSFTDPTKYDTEVSGLTAGNVYEFKWTITGLSPCDPTEDIVNIFNRPEITTANAGADDVLCDQNSSNNSYTLQGNSNPARADYEEGKWTIESAPVGSTASFIGFTQPNTNITGLIPGTYELKWTISNDASCSPSADLMTLKVYAKPEVGTISSTISAVCIGSNNGTLTLNSFNGAIALWENSATQNGVYTPIAGANQSTYDFSNLTEDTWYKVKIVSKGQSDGNCISSFVYSVPFKITVSPVSVGGTTAGETTVCTGTNSGMITLSGETGAVTGWQSSVNGSDWIDISNSAIKPYTFNNLSQTTFFRAVIKSGACSTAYSDVTKITVLPNVDIADAGAAFAECNLNGLINLDANIPANGTGEWKQISGPAITFVDKYDAKSAVNITQQGIYVFEWSISNGICAPSKNTVTFTNYPALVNSIQGVNTYCYAQAVSVTGAPPTGGNGLYGYSWESSFDENTWTTIAGETGMSLNFTADQTAYFRRKVVSGPCEMVSNSVLITVQPPISNNTLIGDQEICIGKSIAIISGSLPAGGDGSYTYSWQSSINQNTWTNIAGANLPEYQPAGLTTTTFFRRIVGTTLCQGAQQSISNTLKITVNPDAKAEFNASMTSACIPFDLGSVITVTPHPDRNFSYEWFANGVSIGIGAAFPGYTITQDGDLVTIKLVTTSKFGCEPDTKEIEFSTVKNVVASFSKDQTQGCGPLTVNFSNLSSPLNGGNYIWDFGNGETSTATQPAPVVFQPHPLHRDTTYIITLKAATACAATIYTDSVTVRPKPLAVFSPDKTIGCSPLEINFSNQSLGMPNTYTIDFGNGDQIVKTDNESFSYTYLTTKTDTFTVKLYAENECGIDSTSYDIVVYPNTITPELVINGSSSYGCAPFTVKFDNNSTGANSFLWDFNDGSTATSSVSPGSMQHTFTQPGTYTVKLTATNGCSTASTTETVVVYPQPTANFTFDKLQYCVNEKVRFNNTSPDNYTFVWDFGDGLTSNAVHPEHAFVTAGIFSVKLTATHTYPDGTSCSFTLVKQLEVLPQPIAAFVTNANALNCAPFTLTVHASQVQTTGGVEWDFGDPNNPTHSAQGFTNTYTFTEPGIYTVKATAYNQSGCADSTTQIIRVTASPKASFSTADTMICGPGKNISFVNTTSYDGTGAVGYRWYINNTFVSTVKNLNYNFNTPSNVILPYIFEVKLIALSTIGCPDTVIHNIQFNPLPHADFTLAQNIGCAPYQAIVNNTSTYADNFKWYLDDNLVSTDRAPQNISLDIPNKTYKLKLVAANIYGCRLDSIEKTLSTHPKPIALFSVNDSVSCNGKLDLQTTNNSTGAISYIWNFGDASPESNSANPSHTYGLPGTYLLRLIAYNGFCRDTSSIEINVSPIPKATFIANKTKGCTKEAITFENLSENSQTYLWDFGDGTFSGSKNPTHTFTYERSPYTIKLIAFGANGCSDTTVMTNYVQISRPPLANFEIAPDSVIKIPDFSFSFKNTSTDGAVSYLWDFGNGRTSTAENPDYTYTDTGSYSVRLIAYNLEGCPDTLTRTVKINGVPGFLFVPNAFEPGSERQDLRIFKLRASGIAEFSIKIFNKWGEMIWESNLLDKDGVPVESWDGMMKGQPAPQGIYIWDVYAKFIDGTEWKGMKYDEGTKRKTGPVHLIR